MERISVAIRVKPTNKQEGSNGTQWKVVENKISLQNEFRASIKGQSYTFDKIFGTSNRNSDIYEHTKDLVLSAVSGFNGTVLAYGQTSSGKTYTMQGSASDPGVTRLAIQDVFINIDKIDDREFLVRVSYTEIYNEEINDLLAPDNRKLQIYESIERGIVVAGLREEIADSVEQVIAVLERGEAQRQFAETDMNLNSSRSHTIFRMVIESRDKSHDYKQDSDPSAQDAVRVSTLNLVDLAGSERFSKSGAEGARSKEGAHINKSLTTLGMVINKLSEGGGKQGSHIPYRDSKLTRILQSALGGNARTAIICTINPDEIHIDETRSTLQFASRAKRVTNCAQVNEILTDAALLKRQKEEIKELRRRLEGSPHTEDLKKEILHLRNDLLKYELGRERLELELQQEIKAQAEREQRIKEQEQRIESLSTLVISGAGAIEDRELPPKKGYRREKWFPQSTTSNTIEQDLRRINSGNDHFSVSASIEANLQPLATPRDITFGPSPAFESLVDDEMVSFSSNSSGVDSLPASGDYQNVADGDLWTSLNSGTQEFADDAYENTWVKTNVRPVNVDSGLSYASSKFENTRESKQAQLPLLVKGSSKISMLQQQLNDMNLQHQELRVSMGFEIQQRTKDAIATANIALLEEKTRFQDQEIKKLLRDMTDMEVELKNYHQENSRLRAKTMILHGQLLHTRAALEQGVQERLSTAEEKEVFKRSLCSLEMHDHYQRYDGAPCLKDGFAHDELGDNEISDTCTPCPVSTIENIRRSSMQYGVSNSDCTLRKPLDERQDTQISEMLMHEVSKRRLFDDKYSLIFQMHFEKNFQNGNESRSRLAPGNAAHSDDALAAFSRLCCRLEQCGDPAAKKKEFSGEKSTVSHEAKNLKSSLYLANCLGNELLQVLHSIEDHDIRFLEGHAASKGTVSKSLEALQVLLLESARVGLRLFSHLSSKESSLAPTKLQQLIQDVTNDGARTFQEDCGDTVNGGHETSLVDALRVKTETGKKNGPHPLPKHNKFFRSVDVGNQRSFLGKTNFEKHKGIFETEVERLNMCRQHIATLNTELAPERIDHERHSIYLVEQLCLSDEILRLMKAKEGLLVRDMEISLGALALQNGAIATICAQIKEFETKAVKLHQGSEIDTDDTKLVFKDVYSIHSTYDTAIRQGMNDWSIDSMAVRNSVGQSNTWYQSLDDASLLSSQDPGEDICNIDLHQACDEEPGVVLSCRSVTLDMQMTDNHRSTKVNQECLLKVQVDEHFAEELKIMRNMSEAEKQFTKELLIKVKALEARLTIAEMEIIEYKVEIEHLKMNNLRTSLDASMHSDDWELQNLRVECEIQKEEIRQLMEQVMTPDHELKRESLLRETMERNNFLEICLKEAERRLIRAKGWLEELLQLRDAETGREKSSHHDNRAKNAALERDGVLFRQEMSKVRQSAVSKADYSREHLNEVSKSDTLNETATRKFQLLSSGGAKNRASLPTSTRKLGTIPARNQDEAELPRGPNCRPLRPALGEAQHNLLQPCTLNNLGGYTCGGPDTKKLHVSDPFGKENQQCPQILFTASH